MYALIFQSGIIMVEAQVKTSNIISTQLSIPLFNISPVMLIAY